MIWHYSKENEIFFIPVKDIFYFESVDGNIFFYTKDETYEATEKLYIIEESLKNLQFSRISKTVIANLDKMLSIKKSENSRLVATLINKEKLVVSKEKLEYTSYVYRLEYGIIGAVCTKWILFLRKRIS